MGKFKTAAMKKKKTVWPAFPDVATIEALKDRYMALEAVQATMAVEMKKGNRWMAMAMGQFPDGDVVTFTDAHTSQEESRLARRRMQATMEGQVPPKGGTPMRYLGSWNFGIADSSKWMATVPQS
jgi:hypothetical protein